jgi:cardiolipin synthase
VIFRVLFILFLSTNVFASEKLIIEPDMGRAPVLTMISQAKNSLDLVMYGFTDKKILDQLIQAKKHGTKINILLEPHPYKNENENQWATTKLKNAQINLFNSNSHFDLTHQKTLISDQRQAMIMTFNFTKSAFDNQRNFALVIDDPTEIKEILSVINTDTQQKNSTVSSPNLIWSPDNSRQKILDLIHQAQHEIKIYAQDISDYQLIGALAKAARSGKSVQVITNQPKPKLARKMAFLKKSGVDIFVSQDYFIHAKVILIDQKIAMLGSINFSKASLEKNRELSIITHDANVLKELLNTFKKDTNSQQASHATFRTKRHRITATSPA